MAFRERAGTAPLTARSCRVQTLLGVVLLGGSLAALRTFDFPGWVAALPVAGTALLITTGPGSAFARALLSRGPLPWLGGVSYAAYLWHWPVLVFARHARGGELPAPLALALTLAAVALAWASTRWLERPFRSGVWSKSRWTAPVLWASMALLVVAAIPVARAIDATPPGLALLHAVPRDPAHPP